jgi:outer membrane protein insertion porin family
MVFFSVSVCSLAQTQNERRFEVERIDFDGNASISSGTLRNLLKTQDSPSGFSTWIYRNISQTLGSRPEYYDPVTFENDYRQVKDFYLAHGFLDVVVDTAILFEEEKQSVALSFHLQENAQYRIDTVIYIGIDGIDSALTISLQSGSLLTSGMFYDRFYIENEKNRILTLLQNTGYPNVTYMQDPYSQYIVSRKKRSGMLKLAFHLGRHYTFGTVDIVNEGLDEIESPVVMRQLDFTEGENYSVEKREVSIQNLNKLGIFESVRILTPFPPTIDTATTSIVPVSVVLSSRKRHEFTPEIFVNDGNEAFNLGIGIGYGDRNFLGEARNFTIRGRLRFQSLQDMQMDQIFGKNGIRDSTLIANGDLTLQLTQPYFYSNRTSYVLALSLIADKQRPYLQTILRTRLGFQRRFAAFTYGNADWYIERSQVATYDSVNARALLQNQTENIINQSNSILLLTLYRDKTNNIFSPSSGFFHSMSIEESGLISLLVRKLQPSLGFSQYFKVNALGRWYYTMASDTSSILALRLHGGFIERYGETRSRKEAEFDIPLNRRFYAGGSGSVRGWHYRALGMIEHPDYGGNAIFEGNLEWRWNIFRPLGKIWVIDFPAMWLVFFVDAGNVWGKVQDLRFPDMPGQIALAAGIGYRYETFFGPFRVDFGFRLYDPKGVPGSKWFTQHRFWKDVFAPGVFHFGIGHAF